MKRNFEIIRDILLKIEENKDDICTSLTEANKVEYIYHIDLLINKRLIEGRVLKLYDGDRCKVDSLTWEGHDFLDAVRSNSIWDKTKNILKEKGLGMSFEIIKKIAIKLLAEEII